GVSDMNVAMLNFQARKMIDRIAGLSAGLTRNPLAMSPAPSAPYGQQHDDDDGESGPAAE
ncbi:MAG TPA: hypothetical protein VGD91_32335, partial [Trebonia sp.]